MGKNVKLSVLMSIFNESECIIKESIKSLIDQTFPNFEVIIVCDNPSRKEEIERFIRSFNDDRLILLCNQSNIGLAMSMNKAAKVARAKVLARMDADDIAEKDRFEKQMSYLNDKKYDFVFCKYIYIDEESHVIDSYGEQELIQPEELSYSIAIKPGIIHHPTVIYTRDIFKKVGGYRDFPCSQDQDLWFRMQEAGCRFLMIPDKLLRYRINKNGVSSKRWYQQQLTIHYIMQLSYKRLKYGLDNFSKENYSKYLQSKGIHDERKAQSLHKSENILSKAVRYRRDGKWFYATLLRLYVFLSSRVLREYYFYVMRKKRLIKHS